MVLPKELVEYCWGCMQLTKCDLLMEILHELTQLLICKVAKLCLEVTWSAPPGWGLPVGDCESPSPSEGRDHGLEGSPPTTVIYALTWCSNGAIVRTAIGSSHNSIAFMALHDAYCISSVMKNRATDSVAKYQSTPKGWVCPHVTHISNMSSSVTEVTLSGVPSVLVNINTLILVSRWGSSDGTWSLPEAVAEDEVDIFLN